MTMAIIGSWTNKGTAVTDYSIINCISSFKISNTQYKIYKSANLNWF